MQTNMPSVQPPLDEWTRDELIAEVEKLRGIVATQSRTISEKSQTIEGSSGRHASTIGRPTITSLPRRMTMSDEYQRHPKDSFWAAWVLLAFIILGAMVFMSGCEAPPPEIKIVTKEEKDQMVVKELFLPPNAKNIVKLDKDWHTFELTIDGRTRKFLRRLHGHTENGGQYQWATDAFTELTPQ